MPIKKTLRVGFAGTPAFAVPALEAICNAPSLEVACVYTQPDRPAGRGRKISASPIKEFASAHGLSILQPENFALDSTVEELKSFALDVLVVAAYGLILPQNVLDAVEYPINIHASLLPRWRGAAPIQRSIMAGDSSTGISIIRIIKKLDAGPVWLQSECLINDEDTASSLHDKLATMGAKTITDALDNLRRGEIEERPQEEEHVTYAEKITTEDRALDWEQSAAQLILQIRALNPTPVATAVLAEQKCKIWEAAFDESSTHKTDSLKPGTIVYARDDGIGVQVKDGILKLTSIQPPGKKPMHAQDFFNGYGDRLDPVEK